MFDLDINHANFNNQTWVTNSVLVHYKVSVTKSRAGMIWNSCQTHKSVLTSTLLLSVIFSKRSRFRGVSVWYLGWKCVRNTKVQSNLFSTCKTLENLLENTPDSKERPLRCVRVQIKTKTPRNRKGPIKSQLCVPRSAWRGLFVSKPCNVRVRTDIYCVPSSSCAEIRDRFGIWYVLCSCRLWSPESKYSLRDLNDITGDGRTKTVHGKRGPCGRDIWLSKEFQLSVRGRGLIEFVMLVSWGRTDEEKSLQVVSIVPSCITCLIYNLTTFISDPFCYDICHKLWR